ncbi:hypothetical protein KR018_009408 [Drosophila ironensis]|nr:hypothetical protein KR018_009408 [Drosophila ironensis]
MFNATDFVFQDARINVLKSNESSPNDVSGGTIVAIAGNDFAMIAADTRLTSGKVIYSRNEKKLFRLTNKTVMGCTGCWADCQSLTRLLTVDIVPDYQFKNNRPPSTNALVHCTSVTLYNRRFDPYQAQIIMVGIDEHNKGSVTVFDCIGHITSESYATAGTAAYMLAPVLDQLMTKPNSDTGEVEVMTAERAVSVTVDLFNAAAERDIFTGDSVIINVITKDGIEEKQVPLSGD